MAEWCIVSIVAFRAFANKSAVSAASWDYVKFQAVIQSAARAACLLRLHQQATGSRLGSPIFGRASGPNENANCRTTIVHLKQMGQIMKWPAVDEVNGAANGQR